MEKDLSTPLLENARRIQAEMRAWIAGQPRYRWWQWRHWRLKWRFWRL
jgi:hypothetical protein